MHSVFNLYGVYCFCEALYSWYRLMRLDDAHGTYHRIMWEDAFYGYLNGNKLYEKP